LVAVVLVLLALWPAAPAHAAPKPVPGVVADLPLTEGDYVRLRESGVKVVRLFMFTTDYNDAGFREVVGRLDALGIKALFVVVGDPAHPPVTSAAAAAFARFVRDRAAEFRGKVEGWEVWNEQDAPAWWAGAPAVDGTVRDTAAYTALLQATFRAVRSVDRTTPVVMGGVTGNDFRFVADVYRHGGRGSFDAVAVHTDTGCALGPPSGFLRDLDGRINQFSFLAYREVRRTMVANGDRRKPIWMTELGWSTTGQLCDTGRFAGQKPGGVSEGDQAAYTAEAFHCTRLAKYVTRAIVFRLRDEGGADSSGARYGLLHADGSAKPAWDALTSYARGGDRLTGPCGDFTPPRITIRLPRARARFPKDLAISVRARDRSGVPRITLLADGRKIRNFTDRSNPVAARGFIRWQGAKRLSPGRHVITVLALDRYRNTARRSVVVVKVRRR
jgi:hypothetical protein